MPDMIDETQRGAVEPTPLADDGKAKDGGAIEPTRREADDGEARLQVALEKERARAQQFRRDARASYRAMEGWRGVRSEEDWMRVCQDSRTQYESGGFLLERLGAQRFLEPALMATLWSLRQKVIADSGITTGAEMMLVDLAILNYYNALRAQAWIGDLALHLERQFFGQDAFAGDKRQERAVEDCVRRLGEQLTPLVERADRMLIRNLKAIKELRQGLVPAIAINLTEQVNVTNQQNGRPRLRPVKDSSLRSP